MCKLYNLHCSNLPYYIISTTLLKYMYFSNCSAYTESIAQWENIEQLTNVSKIQLKSDPVSTG